MFIGRQSELAFLQDRYSAKGGQLIILYGRRRIGKTETLREFCKGKDHVFYACTETTDREQLRSFSARMLAKGIPASRYLSEFADWETALSAVRDLPSGGKKLLVIDEFPYMARGNSRIPSVLQNLWDHTLKDEDVMVILCGSAMSFMEKEVLAEKYPLYGRATGILKMDVMDFYDAIRFSPRYSPLNQVMAYAILGGIPHYLKQFDDALSLSDNIIDRVLRNGAPLYSEAMFLLRQELRETAVYNTIIQAVALGNTKLSDIYSKTGIEKSKLSSYINNLMDLSIIEREFSLDAPVKELAASQRGLYRLTDNYFTFWYAYVFPNMAELEAGDAQGVYQHVIEPTLNAFVSHTFEDICRQYLRKLNRENRLPFHFTRIGRWWDKTTELDIMATAMGRDVLLGECKFKNAPFTLAEYNDALSKYKREDSDAHYFLFSRSGFTKAVLEAGNIARLIDLPALVQG
jgi:uncharacterized protein